MRIDGGDDTRKTCVGCFCSLILMLITAFYAGLKIKVLSSRADINILSATKDLYYSDDDLFSYASNEFNFAVAVSEYNNKTVYELPGDIGKLVYNSYAWG